MKFLLTLFGLVLFVSGYSQITIRPEIQQLTLDIAADGRYCTASISFAGLMPAQWERFLLLKATATRPELRKLSNHKSVAVRCYAFRALVEQQDTAVWSILCQHLKDEDLIEVSSGCVVSCEMAGDLFVSMLELRRIHSNAYSLSLEKQRQLDSMLLVNTRSKLYAKRGVFLRLAPQPNYYKYVRKAARKGYYSAALIALAKFQSEQDIRLIKRFLNHKETAADALRAICEFPHPKFEPILVRYFYEIWEQSTSYPTTWQWLYQALVLYNKPTTLACFEQTIQEMEERQVLCRHLSLAIHKYPSTYFEHLKERIVLNSLQQEILDRELKALQEVD